MVLAARGWEDPAAVTDFLHSGAEQLHDGLQMRGMVRAVRRIRQALEQQELICVYGDYDVDGITATCLLSSYLRSVGGQVLPYVPDRLTEGYSLNLDTLGKLREQGVGLIVTVDCGITNLEEADYATCLGMDLVVTDHHECKAELPRCCAVVNPHQPDCPYPYKQLAGVGVALKLVLALGGPSQKDRLLAEYADLAAIGTVADVMELTGENRAIVRLGLEQLRHSPRPGLAALLREAGLDGKALNSTSISFSLAPRLNAAGRMGCPDLAVRLLLTEDIATAHALAQQLCELNRTRQALELDIFNHCITQLDQRVSPPEGAIVLAGENWHQGVVGIVASRLVERYQLPTFMICMEDGRGKGSCRSPEGFHLFHALEACADLLDSFGGHEQAAGFTISAKNLPEFRRRITAIAKHSPPDLSSANQLLLDGTIDDLSLLDRDNVAALQELEPFGVQNPKPCFLLENAQLISCSGIGGGKHSRLQLWKDGVTLNAIFFSAAPQTLGVRVGTLTDVAFYPQINQFRGVESVQLVLTDVRPSRSPIQRELQLFRRFFAGHPVTTLEARTLLPERQDFVILWRMLVREAGSAPLQDTPERFAARATQAQGQQGRVPSASRAMLCLAVFRERGLIDLKLTERSLSITLRHADHKVDLNSSEILQQLKTRLE
jgi:single-stranded-DNA-specific exonuclease